MPNILQNAEMLDRARKTIGAWKLTGIETEIEAIIAAEYQALEERAMAAAQQALDQAIRAREMAEELERKHYEDCMRMHGELSAALTAQSTAEAALAAERSARQAAEAMVAAERQRREYAEVAIDRRNVDPPMLKVEMPHSTQSYTIDIHRGPDGLMKSLTVIPREGKLWQPTTN